MMKRNLVVSIFLSFAVSLSASASFGQLPPIEIPDSPFLYKSAENYNDSFISSQVNDQAHNRLLPIKIRFPLGATGRLPLIIFSHGGGADDNGREQSSTWGRTLARAGYIVVHISHITGQLGDRQAMCVEFDVTSQKECDNFPILSVWRPRDANAVLAALDELERNNPEISGRIDRNNIGVAGRSYGSLTAMTLCGATLRLSDTYNNVSFANPMVKVGLALSPQGPGIYGWEEDSWLTVNRPLLSATGKGDVDDVDPTSRLQPFSLMLPTKKYQFYIDHPAANHETLNLNNAATPQFHQWLVSYSLAFLDANLKNRQSAQGYLISNRLPLQGSRKTVVIARK